MSLLHCDYFFLLSWIKNKNAEVESGLIQSSEGVDSKMLSVNCDKEADFLDFGVLFRFYRINLTETQFKYLHVEKLVKLQYEA